MSWTPHKTTFKIAEECDAVRVEVAALLARIRVGYPQEMDAFLETAPPVVVHPVSDVLRTATMGESHFFGLQLTGSFMCLLPTIRREIVRIRKDAASEAGDLDEVLDHVAASFFSAQMLRTVLSELRTLPSTAHLQPAQGRSQIYG